MKLLSQISREYKGKKYKKYWIVIPSTMIKKLNWKKGEKLCATTSAAKLTIDKE